MKSSLLQFVEEKVLHAVSTGSGERLHGSGKSDTDLLWGRILCNQSINLRLDMSRRSKQAHFIKGTINLTFFRRLF